MRTVLFILSLIVFLLSGCVSNHSESKEVPQKTKGHYTTKIDDTPNKNLVSQDCADPNIKGDVSSDGKKVYYLPKSPDYKKIIADTFFCSEKYAKDAGYTKSKR